MIWGQEVEEVLTTPEWSIAMIFNWTFNCLIKPLTESTLVFPSIKHFEYFKYTPQLTILPALAPSKAFSHLH